MPPLTSLERTFRAYLSSRDPELLAEVFAGTAPDLLHRARAMVDDENLAEDLVQETFLVVISRAAGFDPARPALPYLTGILRHKAQQALARDRRIRPGLSDLAERIATADRDRVRDREVAQQIDAAAATLPELYREVLRRYLDHRETPAQIGAALGRAPATVRVQLHRGLRLLRAALPPTLAGILAVGLADGTLRAAARPRPSWPGGARTGALPALAGAALVALLGGAWLAFAPERITAPVAVTGAADTTRPRLAAATEPTAPVATPGERVDLRQLRFQVRFADDGAPVPGVGAVVQLRPGHDLDFHTLLRCSDEEGGFRLPAEVPAGTVRILLDRGVDEFVELPAAGSLDKVFEIGRGATVQGRVLDEDGHPVAGAGIWLCRQPRHPWFGQVVGRSGADGTFRLTGLQSMSVVGAVAEGHAVAPLTAITGAPTQQVELCLPSAHGAVTGRVVDPEGAPIAGALVLVGDRPRATYRLPNASDLRCMLPTLQVLTDAAGLFRVDGLPVGEIQVLARAPGRISRLRTVVIDPGRTTDTTLRMEPGAAIRGRVVDESGRPVEGATVEVSGRTGHEATWVRVTPEGRFALDGVRRQYATLLVEAPGYHGRELRPEPQDFAGSACRVVLSAITFVAGRLCDPGGNPVTGEGFEVLVRPPELGRFDMPPIYPVVAGRFRVPLTTAGAEWFVCRGNRQPVWVRASLRDATLDGAQDGAAIELRGDFAATGWIRGRIAGVDPDDLQDAVLMATLGSWSYFLVPKIERDSGEFKAGWLPPGEYALRLLGQHGRFPTHPVGARTVRSGEPTDLGTMVIPTPGRLRYSFGLTTGAVRQMRAWVMDAAGESIPLPAMQGAIGLAPGEYRLQAVSTSFRSIRDHRFTIRAGETTTCEFVRPPAHPRHLEFRLPEGIDSTAAKCRLLGASGEVVMEEDFDERVPGLGEAVVVLDPGRYRLEVWDGAVRSQGTFAICADTDPHVPLAVRLYGDSR